MAYCSLYTIFKSRVSCNITAIIIAIIGFWTTTSLGLSRGFWHWEISTYAIGYYALGNVCKPFLAKEVSSNTEKARIIVLTLCYLCVCLVLGHIGMLDYIEMHRNHYGHRLVFFMLSPIACLAFISFTRVLPTSKYLIEFGRYTLFLFPIHIFVVRRLTGLLSLLPALPDKIKVIFTVSVTFIVCLILARYVYRWLPALGGKKKWI